MDIEILGAESLGVRGLSCFVVTKERRIAIDPGVALGYRRHGLLPHPFQVAVGAVVRKKILSAVQKSTDVVLSHFHGDHVPLADANPYQLSLDLVSEELENLRVWGPNRDTLDGKGRSRRDALSAYCGHAVRGAMGVEIEPFSFSSPMPHGEYDNGLGDVMMTRIRAEGTVFVHASDIQLLETKPIRKIISWEPDIVLAGGPPLYLPQLSKEAEETAWEHAQMLSQNVPTLVLDHHLLRSRGGVRWLKELDKSTDNSVRCAAEFMNTSQAFLEAWRRTLYKELSVPDGWHKAYSRKQIDTTGYQTWRGWDLREELAD